MPIRLDLLHRWAPALLLPLAFAMAAPPPAPPPHLLAGPEDFDRLRAAAARPGFTAELTRLVLARARHELDEPVATREMEGRRLLHVSRAVLRRTLHGGLAYHLTGDEPFARRALADLHAAATFSDWNPDHFLDTAEMTTAFALGLDWFRDLLAPTERRALEDAVIRLGLEPGLARPDAWWITATNNWNAVCHGGLLLGAFAVQHRRPDLADAILTRALRHLPLHGTNYAPEGAFIEGSNYWGYGTTYHVLAVETLRRVTGSAHGLDTLPGFRESAAYVAHLVGPTGQFYSYFDGRPARIGLPALFWFGRHFDQPWLTAFEARHYATLAATVGETATTAGGEWLSALALLWLEPDHLAAPAAPPSLAWSGTGPNPVALWRDAWTSTATYLGAKGGRATLSHGHLDAGSFVFEAGGVRWALDLGMEEYHRLEAMGVKLWGADRWALFRLGPESHSLPRLGDVMPDPAGDCPRIDWTDTPRPTVTFDLTALYPRHVARLHRTIATREDGTTVWRDECRGLAPGSPYRFTWVTTADVHLTEHGVDLTQNGRTLRLRARGDAPVAVKIHDEASLLAPVDTPTPGLKRIDFTPHLTGPDATFELTAELLP